MEVLFSTDFLFIIFIFIALNFFGFLKLGSILEENIESAINPLAKDVSELSERVKAIENKLSAFEGKTHDD